MSKIISSMPTMSPGTGFVCLGSDLLQRLSIDKVDNETQSIAIVLDTSGQRQAYVESAASLQNAGYLFRSNIDRGYDAEIILKLCDLGEFCRQRLHQTFARSPGSRHVTRYS